MQKNSVLQVFITFMKFLKMIIFCSLTTGNIIEQGNVYRDSDTCDPGIYQPPAGQDDPQHRFQQEGSGQIQQQDNERGEWFPETSSAVYGALNTR